MYDISFIWYNEKSKIFVDSMRMNDGNQIVIDDKKPSMYGILVAYARRNFSFKDELLTLIL